MSGKALLQAAEAGNVEAARRALEASCSVNFKYVVGEGASEGWMNAGVIRVGWKWGAWFPRDDDNGVDEG